MRKRVSEASDALHQPLPWVPSRRVWGEYWHVSRQLVQRHFTCLLLAMVVCLLSGAEGVAVFEQVSLAQRCDGYILPCLLVGAMACFSGEALFRGLVS